MGCKSLELDKEALRKKNETIDYSPFNQCLIF